MWILALWANPPARKFIIYGAIILAVLFALRLYGNMQWAKGQEAGRQYEAKAIEKAKQAEWKAKEAAIAQSAADLATERAVVKATADQLSQDRANLSRTLKDSLAKLTQAQRRDYENIVSIAPSDLDRALRDLSRQLAAK